MTGQFEDFKSEIVARLPEHLILFVQQGAADEILIRDFERGLFHGLLAVGVKVMDIFLRTQGGVDQRDVMMHDDQLLDRSVATVR